ncbi:hypothetical protein DC081_09065 [Ignatzschineria cameli]|uniref:phage head morphogenesis protein n=1 Tax=Ignatzschineria cameli TaxID=2182793 RepID=UPI000D61F973|nr:phage minor head protein [Ignatzschineria cameli]PWD89589.1 hypothetical protein DC081_09065 [Ignatzschineria cameli]
MPTSNPVNKFNIAYALKLTPTRAIEYFKKLGVKVSDEFVEQALMRARQKAFTVSNIHNARIVDHIYQEILTAIEAGKPADAFIKEVRPTLKKMGLYSDDLPAYRLKQMMRGSMQTAFNAGRYQAQKANINNQPWWIRIEVIDERTRPSHVAVNKIAARADDPWWDNNYPPYLDGKFEYGCRGRVRAVSDRRFQEMLKNDPTIRVIESNSASTTPAIDDDGSLIKDGIQQVKSSAIQEALREKLNV